MKSAYARALWASLRMNGVWRPGDPVRLGDYGVLREGCFAKIGHLSTLIPDQSFPTRNASTLDIAVMSKGGVRAVTKAGAGDLARVSFRFSGDRGVVLLANGVTATSFAELKQLSERLLPHKEWRSTYHLVTTLHRAKRFMLLMTGENGGEIAVKGRSAALEQLEEERVDLDGDLSVEKAEGLSLIGGPAVFAVNLHRKARLGDGFKYAHSDESGDPDDGWRLVPSALEPRFDASGADTDDASG